ncbi:MULTISPECIES: low molecular weight protein arginine phosphatase [unclassified Paenibacillus]|uniref:low molecular weight protein arginine phosphatase n=1 Tax=unclassified Paenibacillus TaxID=185978 RepID=UPI00070AB13D|nr:MULTISPECIES: low molecular weight protein arginine phosphatase [unclassified Paenibacillus]KQX60149.1 protein tyrosine phosphatase [Paenibacillus sp. Root444D2]KRE41762.1 protein tyrosine phosphatase [Paenibacillus sp. Soil724D2]
MLRILFVCTGNTCRSPLAEGLLRIRVHQEGLAAEVRSAGVSAVTGGPISRNSASLLQEAGFKEPISSLAIQESEVNWADLILTMTMGHKRTVIQRFPDAIEKTFTLKEYVEDDAHILQAIEEREQLVTELQLKQALSQAVSVEERNRIFKLEHAIPDFDISDPFGGSIEIYRQTAEEISGSLDKLVQKIRARNEGSK